MGADEVEIRRLDPARLDELIVAQNEIFVDYIIQIKSSRQFFLEFLRSVGGNLSTVLVALRDGRMIGYVNPVIDGREAWIGGVGVVPEHRRKGIGRKLIEAAEELCRAEGATDISLEVIEGNMRAQELYEQMGYRVSRTYLTAEGKPAKFEGYGKPPVPASITEVLPIHGRAYKDTCWQRRKVDALVQSGLGADIFRTEGGFVVIRSIETNGFIPFLGVVPEHRRKGLGTSLAKFALTRLHNKGAFKVVLYNVNEDLPTLRMLDMFDFKVTMKQIEMHKDLSPQMSAPTTEKRIEGV